MKTKLNTSNLKKSAITAGFVVIFGTIMTAQPKPENNSSEYMAQSRLENLLNVTEKLIKYEAPDTYLVDEMLMVYENNNAVDALNSLVLLAAATQKELQYVAPSVKDQAPATPAVEFARRWNRSEMTVIHHNRMHKVAPEYTLQESWLINAGYYKTTRTPVLNKINQGFRTRRAARQYASK